MTASVFDISEAELRERVCVNTTWGVSEAELRELIIRCGDLIPRFGRLKRRHDEFATEAKLGEYKVVKPLRRPRLILTRFAAPRDFEWIAAGPYDYAESRPLKEFYIQDPEAVRRALDFFRKAMVLDDLADVI